MPHEAIGPWDVPLPIPGIVIDVEATDNYVMVDATDGGTWVGSLEAQIEENYVFIASVQVAETHQRRGLATAMLREVVERYPGRLYDGVPVSDQGEGFLGALGLPRYLDPRDVSDRPVPGRWASHTAPWAQTVARTATSKEAALPTGITLVFNDDEPALLRIRAEDTTGRMIGTLSWWSDTGEVYNVSVREEYRRQGVATAMWDQAKEHEPRLHHSDDLSQDGAAWAQTVAHTASVVPYPGETIYRGLALPWFTVTDVWGMTLEELEEADPTEIATRIVETFDGTGAGRHWSTVYNVSYGFANENAAHMDALPVVLEATYEEGMAVEGDGCQPGA